MQMGVTPPFGVKHGEIGLLVEIQSACRIILFTEITNPALIFTPLSLSLWCGIPFSDLWWTIFFCSKSNLFVNFRALHFSSHVIHEAI